MPVHGQSTRATPLRASYITRNIENTSGLDCNDVYSITQDHQGYIWIGTKNGLQRYDGLRFVNCFDSTIKPRDLMVSGLNPDDKHARILYGQADARLKGWDVIHHTQQEITRQTAPGQDLVYQDRTGKQWFLRVIWTDSSKKDTCGIMLIRQPGLDMDKQGFFIIDKTHHRLIRCLSAPDNRVGNHIAHLEQRAGPIRSKKE